MIQISDEALREGCERARDLFLLNRLRDPDEAAAGFDAAFQALGLDPEMRTRLQDVLVDLVPVKGMPMLEATTAASMTAGVLVGLLIADSTLPVEELDLPLTPGS